MDKVTNITVICQEPWQIKWSKVWTTNVELHVLAVDILLKDMNIFVPSGHG
jgi:hypothetical protein